VSESGIQAALPVHEVFRVPEIPAAHLEPLPQGVDASQRAILEGVINMSTIEQAEAAEGRDTLTLLDVASLFEAPQVQALRSRR
jgi:hypothetical protein